MTSGKCTFYFVHKQIAFYPKVNQRKEEKKKKKRKDSYKCEMTQKEQKSCSTVVRTEKKRERMQTPEGFFVCSASDVPISHSERVILRVPIIFWF